MKMTLTRLWPVMALLAALSLPATTMADAKCPHDAPKELCFICDPALREKGRLWCKEHNRYEDRCWECHAELQDKARAFCTKHNLYVDECFLCKPELKKAKAAAAPSEKCMAHGAPKELCFICDASLREKGRLWCKEHDRYEDRCWECHPDLRDAKRAFCEKHALYADECFLCKPELKAKPKTGAQAPSAGPRLMCKEHNVAEDECGICHPDLAGKPGLKVRFPSAQAAAKAGIVTAPPQIGPMADGIECYAEIQFNQNQLAQIAAPVGGIIQAVEADLGDKVETGQMVARIWSSTIGEAVAKAVLTQQTVARERKLHAERISSEKDLQEAEAAYRAARQQLKTLGFDEKQIEALAAQSVETALLELRAPFAGEIVERNAVRGALVEAGKSLFTLVDRSTMWAMLNIPERHLAGARVGQKVEFRVDALPDQTFTGTLTWIAAKVDDRTRMAQARAEVPDPAGVLRAQMFAKVRILTGNTDKAVIVPAAAIQCIEKRDFVFIKVADDLYEARLVRIGAKLNGNVAIAEGLRAEDLVVVEGGFIAKSQFLISKLGAGCVD
ncbi:MAG: Multidrug resistance protein MdtA [Verrucomicrobiae bacterium]|nr:Multidrug resistance protein MdtA [Verrucomicrobiae bacterium]